MTVAQMVGLLFLSHIAGGQPASPGGGRPPVLCRAPSAHVSGKSVTVSYDSADRPLVVSGPNGTMEFAYDPVHKRLIGVTTTGSGPTYQVAYSNYPDGKVATMTSSA